MALQTIKETIKHRKFLIDDGNFEMMCMENCYIIVVNGQIYIGEYNEE